MGYAYEWLTEKEKKNIPTFLIIYAVNKICIQLGVGEYHRRFVYTKDVEGFTSVVDNHNKKQDAWIEKYFVDVACEDLNLLVANQKSKLSWLMVDPADETDHNQNTMDPIINKIFENLSQSVASRSSPLQVDTICVSPTKVSEVMSVIRHLDQSELINVTLRFNGRNEPGKIDDTMIDWNGDSEWKMLVFVLENLTREDLEGLSKIFSSQRFDDISVYFKSCDEKNIGSFFDTELFYFQIDKGFFSIEPHIERARPSPDKKKTSQLELIKSSLPENMATEVLGNSVIMETILEELEVFDIQRLRKVCRGVRDCIDDVKPEPHINAYEIDVTLCRISVKIESKHETRIIKYKCDEDAQNDYYINLLQKETCLDEEEKRALEDFNINRIDKEKWLYECEKRASNNFHINLLHQKKCLEKLWIRPGAYIGELLKGRKTALKVENLTMDTKAQEDVMQILPYLDKDFLKKIRIILQRIIIDVAEMARTDQWKRASQLLIEGNRLITPIQKMNITHFSMVDVLMKTLSSDDVVYLKTELLKSSTLEKFRIKFRRSDINERLQTLIGEPYRITSNFKKIWYFRMPYTDYYLHIALDTQDIDDEYGFPEPKTIVFSKVPKEDTPFFQ